MEKTTLENKCAILSDLWLNYRYEEEFTDFVEYADLGLPLAYAIDAKIVEPTKMAISFIDESFDLLLSMFDLEDTGFENLDDLLALGEE